MNTLKQTKFLFEKHNILLEETKKQIEESKKTLETDEDIKDLYELVLYKENLKKGLQELAEKKQILEEEIKINEI